MTESQFGTIGNADESTAQPHLSMRDFDFDLPEELIAQEPLPERDASRLLVLDPPHQQITHSTMSALPQWLHPGDLLVANNSRVLPARLHGARAGSGGKVELLLLRNLGGPTWQALAKPARKLRPGEQIVLQPRDESSVNAGAAVTIADNLGEGQVIVEIPADVQTHLADYGEMPLPPYIHTALAVQERYQTTYARVPGSAAAPTAGLHITERLRERLAERGIGWTEVTLQVGLDTFRPVQTDDIAEHKIHTEWCTVSDETARRIADTRAAGGRIVAVGTTSARVLETLGREWDDANPHGLTTDTDIFIVPGHEWRLVDARLPNFQLPKSTLLLLVSALAGREFILQAYTEAIKERYRFFSFGDAMLINGRC
jgi:S-adenosylmethionine:tRNA ribosyltransferase-isomerase